MIEIEGLTKKYGDTLAVDDLTFTVQPGRVTGFLGPNGSGKSTTMRMVLGLDAPTSGRSLVAGRPYVAHPAPLTSVGALLEHRGAHPGRTARAHLRVLAATHGIGLSRVDEVLELVGLASAAGRRTRAFSLGMSQRLGIAAALLGDPAVVLLDEPVNGLDPDGVRWIRDLLQRLAEEGRTVFVSSHLMSEMAQTADHLVVIARGRLVADLPVDALLAQASGDRVVVRTSDAVRLAGLLAGPSVSVTTTEGNLLEVQGVAMRDVGDLACRHGLAIHELSVRRGSLEEAFMKLTSDGVEFGARELAS